jgi:3D (Asp-Asp-Asp) domain-containing protein
MTQRSKRARVAWVTLLAAAVASGAVSNPASGAGLAAAAAKAKANPNPTGGAPLGGLAPTQRRTPSRLRPPSKHSHGRWLSGVTITEYWPAPEAWFVGRLVGAPGLSGRHRIDWLYSALGVSMDGDGLGLDGRQYHLDSPGSGGWVTKSGAATSPADGWASGPPYWRAGGYWRNQSGGVTFPLVRGGWSAGSGLRYVPLPGVTFRNGPSLQLRFYQSIAVDPAVIPLGSRIYVPAYKQDSHGGWFIAQDTGGAISGAHIDVYRSPPRSATSSGNYFINQRIYVIRPRW